MNDDPDAKSGVDYDNDTIVSNIGTIGNSTIIKNVGKVGNTPVQPSEPVVPTDLIG